MAGSEADRMRKTVCKIFNNLGLRLTINTGMKVVNFLDVALNLADGTYSPYRKPNNTLKIVVNLLSDDRLKP